MNEDLIEIYDLDDFNIIIDRKNKIKKELIITSVIFTFIYIVICILFVNRNEAIFYFLTSLISIVFSVYFLLTLYIRIGVLNKYFQFLKKVQNDEKETINGFVKEKSSYPVTKDGLLFNYVIVEYNENTKKEVTLFIEESVDIQIEVNKNYVFSIFSNFLYSYKEVINNGNK